MIPITEDDKRRLADHLINIVTTGLSGRDGRDFLDAVPSRTIFAGVLQSPRQSELKNAHISGNPAPAGTALGVDFRVRRTDPHGKVMLSVLPRWSVYYPIFPSYPEALTANDIVPESIAEVPVAAGPEQAEADSGELEEGNSEDSGEGGESTAIVDSGLVVLPRKWRRCEVTPLPAVIEINDATSFDEFARPELESALSEASDKILSDPDLWRHLASPAKRERSPGNRSVLADAEAYSRALSKASPPVLPPNWSANILIEVTNDPDDDDVFRVKILLANTTPEGVDVPDSGLEERSLFDAGLKITINGGTLVPSTFWLAPKDYRSDPTIHAKGINCTARWDEESQLLVTDTLPIFRQPLYRTRDVTEVRFEQLDTADPTPHLEALAISMKSYLKNWDDFIATDAVNQFSAKGVAACKTDRDEFAEEIDRFQIGIEALKRDAHLAKAFRFMNRVFGRLALKSGGKVKSWRLFQVGFIVSQLPALAVRELGNTETDTYTKRLRAMLDEVAILWFPTGGGKTEAYLGLIATALLYDRLRSKTRGVCAWMRFPLRMLSLQQMERLARVIAALNEFRAEEHSVSTGDPFAIGYYVGDANTPNSLSEEDMRRYEHGKSLREEARLLRKCPFCNSSVDVKPLRQSWRLAHVCSNESCFSNTNLAMGDYKGSLPVCVVDTEIYRYLPSVLVGTVDKLAIIARHRYFAHLVRGPKQRCRAHGYTSYDECVERFSGCKASRKDLLTLSPLPDPGISLLIQDELHLLRAELGVFNGHYEGLLRHLGDRAFLRPKVLAATATIEAYDTQAFHIYLSKARRYPQPSWQQGESFYATCKPEQHRRIYLGVLGHTRGIEEPTVRILALYQREVRRLIHAPAEAAQIMNRPDVTADAVLEALRLYDLSLCYVNKKATGGSIVDKLVQLERSFEREGLGSLKAQLLTSDQTIDDIGSTLDRIEMERAETGNPRLNAVVATNLISHGVDLERINMMAVSGMPSHYAEYVQSSSRAARSHPGVVFVCFKGRDPRETSQFEFFQSMHSHMERLIEAVAVNRFASFAPKKTVPGLIAGLLLCDLTPDLYGSKITKPLDHLPTLQIALGQAQAPQKGTIANCVDPSYLLKAIRAIIGVDVTRPPASPAQIEHLRTRVDDVFNQHIASIGRSMENQLKAVLNPITSFRDVDEGIDFGSIDSGGFVTRLRAR